MSWLNNKKIIKSNLDCLKLVQTNKGTNKMKWSYVCDERNSGCGNWTNLPEELQNKLRGDENGENI